MRLLSVFSLAVTLVGTAVGESPRFHVGSCTHFAQRKGEPGLNLDLAVQAGITSIRDEVSWSAVERKKGELKIPDYFDAYLDGAVRRGIHPLVILNYGNRHYDGGSYPVSAEAVEGYARYCEFIIRHAGDRVKLFQFWNEWDGGCGMKGFGRGRAGDYVKLQRAVYSRVKKIAPDATFIANAVCTGEQFLEETFKLGVLDSCDAIAFHPYNYSRSASERTPEAWLERMHKLRRLIRRYNNGRDKPVYITEMGWPNHESATGTSERMSAVYLARLYLYARTLPFIRGIWWYDFQDDGWDCRNEQHNFGLLRADLTAKVPFFAMKSIAGRFSRSEFVGTEELPGGLVLRFREDSGDFLAVVNRHSGISDLRLVLESRDRKPRKLWIETVGSAPVAPPWGWRNWAAGEKNVRSEQLSVTVGEMPVLISGELGQVTVAEASRVKFPRNRPPAGERSLLQEITEVVVAGAHAPETPFRNYVKLAGKGHEGPEDLSAVFRCGYDRDNLRLTITVKDNFFHQPEKDIESLWQGDSIQAAFQVVGADGLAVDTFLDAAWVDGKPEVVVREAGGDRRRMPVCSISHRGNTTEYRLTVPAHLLGTKAFEPGAVLAGALLVNDNDGNGRKGFITWGHGIGIRREPGRYNLLFLQ